MARIQPVRPAPAVDQFDADRMLVVAARMMSRSRGSYETVHAAVAIDVVVATIAGAAIVENSFAVVARRGQIRQFRAVDHDEIDHAGGPLFQTGFIGQGPI